jgi:hypothetical protein
MLHVHSPWWLRSNATECLHPAPHSISGAVQVKVWAVQAWMCLQILSMACTCFAVMHLAVCLTVYCTTPRCCCRSRIYEAAGMDFYSSPLGCVGQQGTGSDGTTPAPFLRLSLLLLAMAQHWRHAAALPPGSVRNSPIGSPRDIAALQRAVQQQVTPSCCSQMLVQHAPSYYVVVNADVLPGGLRMIMTGDMDDLCTVSLDQALIAVGSMCSVWTPAQRPCYAMGECNLCPRQVLHSLACNPQLHLWYAAHTWPRCC